MANKRSMTPDLKARLRPLKVARTLRNKLRRVYRSSGVHAATAFANRHGLKMPDNK